MLTTVLNSSIPWQIDGCIAAPESAESAVTVCPTVQSQTESASEASTTVQPTFIWRRCFTEGFTCLELIQHTTHNHRHSSLWETISNNVSVCVSCTHCNSLTHTLEHCATLPFYGSIPACEHPRLYNTQSVSQQFSHAIICHRCQRSLSLFSLLSPNKALVMSASPSPD